MSTWPHTLWVRVRDARRRLLDQAGETMVETLVSVLICAIALLLLASAVGAAVHTVSSSRTVMAEYYADESAMVSEGTATTTAPVSITDAATGHSLRLDAADPDTLTVTVYPGPDGVALYERIP